MTALAALLAAPARAATGAAARGIQDPSALQAEDIGWLIDRMVERYVYLPDRHIDLAKLRAIYVPMAQATADRDVFLGVLEHFLAEFHDHHIGPNTNNQDSPVLIPTGAEIWAGFHDGHAIIEAVRPGSLAARSGLRAGDEILKLDDLPVRAVVAAHMPRALSAPDPEANDYVLRVLLNGTHNSVRNIYARSPAGGVTQAVLAPHQSHDQNSAPLAARREGDVAVLRIQNSLGDSDLVAAMDKALDDAHDARAIILDLRDTPSGGSTDVAEPIMGRFIKHAQGYQRIFTPGRPLYRGGEHWVKQVRPRKPLVDKPLAVLVDRWTGSMGEGMAIGFDSMKRATVVGTRMAGLCGAIEQVKLPGSGIGVNFATERLYHLDGTPREKWKPPVFVDLATVTGDDPILERALQVLRS